MPCAPLEQELAHGRIGFQACGGMQKGAAQAIVLCPALIALVEFIIYAFTSEERLNEKYSAAGGAGTVIVIVVVVAFVGVAVIGILAAVAIPAYHDYTVRAKVSEGIVGVVPWRSCWTIGATRRRRHQLSVAGTGSVALTSGATAVRRRARPLAAGTAATACTPPCPCCRTPG